MKTLYAACLSRVGLTQSEAAALHNVSVQTVKNWCSGRSKVPPGIWGELQDVEAAIRNGEGLMSEAHKTLTIT